MSAPEIDDVDCGVAPITPQREDHDDLNAEGAIGSVTTIGLASGGGVDVKLVEVWRHMHLAIARGMSAGIACDDKGTLSGDTVGTIGLV